MNTHIKLVEVTEKNWLQIAMLSVHEEQKEFCASTIGMIARGYVYRECNGRVWGITCGEQMVGAVMVRDLNEEPCCYDLQQFMIDKQFQKKGYGEAALRQVLSILKTERRFDCVEVCVKNTDIPALRLYEKVGFKDTGYIDADLPEFVNLMFCFSEKTIAKRNGL